MNVHALLAWVIKAYGEEHLVGEFTRGPHRYVIMQLRCPGYVTYMGLCDGVPCAYHRDAAIIADILITKHLHHEKPN